MKRYCAIGAAVFPLLAMAAPLQITLKETAVAPGRDVLLGDIAAIVDIAIDTEHADAMRAYAGIRVAAAPRAGHTLRLRRDDIARLVNRVSGTNARLAWNGAEIVSIRASGQQLSGKDIEDAATNALRGMLHEKHPAAQVRILAPASDVALPEGTVSLRARLADNLPRRNMTVAVDIHLAGEYYATARVAAAITESRTILRARRPLSAGEPVAGKDFEYIEIDAIAIGQESLAALPSGAAVRMRKNLRAGDILTAEHILPADGVVAGDMVNLRIRQHGILVEARAVAERSGDVGQRIPIRVGGQRERILARLDAGHIATVEGW